MLYVATMQVLHYNKLQPAKQVHLDTLPFRQIMPQRSLPFVFKVATFHFSSHKCIFHLIFSSLDQNYEIT